MKKKKCSKCGLGTYIKKNGKEYWHYDKERNLICNSCICKQWRISNQVRARLYQIEMQPRRTQLERERRALKTGSAPMNMSWTYHHPFSPESRIRYPSTEDW